jgi:hydrogenase maturation protease
VTAVHIIGIGSPRGWDRVGWEAVRGLEARGLPGRFPATTIRLSIADRPGSRLVNLVEKTSAVILVDALRGGAVPGTVLRLTPEQLDRDHGISSHGVGVAQALSLAAALGRLPAHLSLYGIAIDPDAHVRDLSPDAAMFANAVTLLEPLVCQDIRTWSSSTTDRAAAP